MSTEPLTLHHFRIHKLKHPSGLQLCKNYLEKEGQQFSKCRGVQMCATFLESCNFCLRLTLIAEKVCWRAPGPVVANKGCVGAIWRVDAVIEATDAFLSQKAHKELQADEGEHTETENGQDHHIGQLPHRLDQSTDYRLQTWKYKGNWWVLIIPNSLTNTEILLRRKGAEKRMWLFPYLEWLRWFLERGVLWRFSMQRHSQGRQTLWHTC